MAIQDEIGVKGCLNAINNLVYDIATKEAGSPRIVSYYPGKAVLSLREIGISPIENKTKELTVSFEFEAIMNSDQYQLSHAQNIIKNCPGIALFCHFGRTQTLKAFQSFHLHVLPTNLSYC